MSHGFSSASTSDNLHVDARRPSYPAIPSLLLKFNRAHAAKHGGQQESSNDEGSRFPLNHILQSGFRQR